MLRLPGGEETTWQFFYQGEEAKFQIEFVK